LTPKELSEQISKMAGEEIDRKQWSFYYLSWAKDGTWLGGAFAPGYGPITARLRCSAMGIRPEGGECLVVSIPTGQPVPPEEYRDRLLTKEEVLKLYPDSKTIGEFEKEKP